MAEIEVINIIPKPRKSSVEDCRRVSIKDLIQHNVFTSGKLVRWKQPFGNSVFEVGAMAVEDMVILVAGYEARQIGGVRLKREGKPVGEQQVAQMEVKISWSECHYGGKRPWFLCRNFKNGWCQKRVAALYFTKDGFMCRHCAELGYRSDNASDYERGILREESIMKRLGGTGTLVNGFPPRPKGMHYKTYQAAKMRAQGERKGDRKERLKQMEEMLADDPATTNEIAGDDDEMDE